MKAKVHVLPSGGKWMVSSSSDPKSATTVFSTKSEAISAARNLPGHSEVIVHTSTGQAIRTPQLKTSRDAQLMRDAVINAVARVARHG